MFVLLMAIFLSAPAPKARPLDQTFNITAQSLSNYLFDGIPDPTLNLERGATYTFNLNVTGHPFWIKTVATTGTGNAYNNGVTGNGSQTGSLVFVVPMDAPNTLFYNCQIHSPMTGQINITNPASVGDEPAAAFRIFPNPAHGGVRFERPASLTGGAIEILDLRGRVISRIDAPGAATVAWDGRGKSGAVVAPGVYLVRVKGADGSVMAKRMFWLGR